MLALSSPRPARADASAEKAAARELAVEGIRLAQAGQCAEALPKLERAESLYHAPTILAWIGDCQVQLGALVEGTENLNRVVHEQLPAGAPAAFFESQERARVLRDATQPRIARLTIELTPADAADVEIQIDGAPMSAAMLGAPRPTDPGQHTVVVSAPGFARVERLVELAEAARETLRIELAPLEDAGATPAGPAGEQGGERRGSAVRTWGWVGVGTGAALLAGGGVFGAMALGAKGDLDCPGGACAPDQEDELDAANTYATTSTVLFSIGGALAATGVVLVILGREPRAPEVALGGARLTPLLGPTSVGLGGRF
jgi:hypothetical protein